MERQNSTPAEAIAYYSDVSLRTASDILKTGRSDIELSATDLGQLMQAGLAIVLQRDELRRMQIFLSVPQVNISIKENTLNLDGRIEVQVRGRRINLEVDCAMENSPDERSLQLATPESRPIIRFSDMDSALAASDLALAGINPRDFLNTQARKALTKLNELIFTAFQEILQPSDQQKAALLPRETKLDPSSIIVRITPNDKVKLRIAREI